MNNDANKLDYITHSLHYLWIGPVQTVIIACLLYWYFGSAPVAGYIGKKASMLMLLSAQRTSERLRLMKSGVQAPAEKFFLIL
ncbi:hypothetical protein M0802_012624 [Mischocyttarus mexicanus]|nr:hypothetical protein M0802_012624 [Mischocyttarus mexicanus]